MSKTDPRLLPELLFWKDEIAKYPGEDYATIRAGAFSNLLAIWPEIGDLKGTGLDLGCSPASVFEHSGLDMYACDPLMEQYQKLYMPEQPTVNYVLGHKDDGLIQFRDSVLDFVFCINVIDHTPHHKLLLSEIYRIIKPGGLFFIMVNFDTVLLAPNHCMLWNPTVVGEELAAFWLLKGMTVWNEEYQKHMYWGKYRVKV